MLCAFVSSPSLHEADIGGDVVFTLVRNLTSRSDTCQPSTFQRHGCGMYCLIS